MIKPDLGLEFVRLIEQMEVPNVPLPGGFHILFAIDVDSILPRPIRGSRDCNLETPSQVFYAWLSCEQQVMTGMGNATAPLILYTVFDEMWCLSSDAGVVTRRFCVGAYSREPRWRERVCRGPRCCSRRQYM